MRLLVFKDVYLLFAYKKYKALNDLFLQDTK